MRTACIVVTLLSTLTLNAQTTFFKVSDTLLTKKEKLRIEKLFKQQKVFYEDNDYLVSKTCSGEFGGTVKFKNKRTGIEYSCSSTCPVSVIRINYEYFVTSSLDHMFGSTQIIKISDPQKMEESKVFSPKTKNENKNFRTRGYMESKSTKGTEILIASGGILTLGSYLFEGNFFHLITSFKDEKTYIAKVQNGKLEIIQLVVNSPVWPVERDNMQVDNDHLIIPIKDGYIEVLKNKVTLQRSK